MAVKKYKRQFNSAYKGAPGSKQSDESQTDPSMYVSMKQMLINHARGINSKVHQYEPMYFGDTPIPEINDLVDAQEYVENLEVQKNAAGELVNQEVETAIEKKANEKRKKQAADGGKNPSPKDEDSEEES